MNAKIDKIIEALGKLDVENDNHWTSDGLPKLDALKFSVGESVTREEVNTVAPGYTRSNPFFVQEPVQSQPVENAETEQPAVGSQAGDSQEGEEPSKAAVIDSSLIVNVKLDDVISNAFEKLPTDFSNLTHEESIELRDHYTKVIQSESVLEDQIRRHILERQRQFSLLCEHVDRTAPKTKLNDQLVAFRNAVAKSDIDLPINRPRQIVRQGRGGYGR